MLRAGIKIRRAWAGIGLLAPLLPVMAGMEGMEGMEGVGMGAAGGVGSRISLAPREKIRRFCRARARASHICRHICTMVFYAPKYVAYMHAKTSTEICQTYMTHPGLALTKSPRLSRS